jgi:hypothetical protein
MMGLLSCVSVLPGVWVVYLVCRYALVLIAGGPLHLLEADYVALAALSASAYGFGKALAMWGSALEDVVREIMRGPRQ